MKIEANYEPVSGNLNLSYDTEAQSVLKQTAKRLSPLLNTERTPLEQMLDEEVEDDIKAPIHLLAELGSSPSRTMRVRPKAMQRLLNLISSLVLSFHDHRKPVKPLDHALILLSGVTPLSVLPLDLPPASEVFDRATVNEGAMKAYETLRAWDKNTLPHLYAVQMHHLCLALGRVNHRNETLETLFSSLEISTSLFRWAVEALALAEVSGNKRGRRKK